MFARHCIGTDITFKFLHEKTLRARIRFCRAKGVKELSMEARTADYGSTVPQSRRNGSAAASAS